MLESSLGVVVGKMGLWSDVCTVGFVMSLKVGVGCGDRTNG